MRNAVHHPGTPGDALGSDRRGTRERLSPQEDGQAGFHLTSLNKALDVLEAFTLDRPEWSLGELGAELELSKPTLRRVLQNLAARGFVRQEPVTRKYRLGLKCWEVGVVATGGLSLDEAARPLLVQLAHATGEQPTLWAYEDGDAVCIARVEASQRVRSHTRLGTREPAHLLAAGRCLLAYREPDEIDRLRGSEAGDDLAKRLDRVRRVGYEVSQGDRWEDVYAVGAPVREHFGTAVAAISVSGPSARFDDDAVKRIAQAVTDAAGVLSTQLGFHQDGFAPEFLRSRASS